jgi:transposase
MTGYCAYWIGQIARRFNDEGEEGLVNHRKRSRPSPHALLATADELDELRSTLTSPAPQGDVWNSRTVAAWLSARAGRPVSTHAALHYLHLLNYTPQAPRPRHTKAASTEERTAFKKSWRPR